MQEDKCYSCSLFLLSDKRDILRFSCENIQNVGRKTKTTYQLAIVKYKPEEETENSGQGQTGAANHQAVLSPTNDKQWYDKIADFFKDIFADQSKMIIAVIVLFCLILCCSVVCIACCKSYQVKREQEEAIIQRRLANPR